MLCSRWQIGISHWDSYCSLTLLLTLLRGQKEILIVEQKILQMRVKIQWLWVFLGPHFLLVSPVHFTFCVSACGSNQVSSLVLVVSTSRYQEKEKWFLYTWHQPLYCWWVTNHFCFEPGSDKCRLLADSTRVLEKTVKNQHLSVFSMSSVSGCCGWF